MNNKKAVFETTYRQLLSQMADLDLAARAERLGAKISGNKLIIPFFEQPYQVSRKGVTDRSEHRVNLAVSVVICRYVLNCPAELPADGDWMTFRDFKDAGPLAGHFTTNTNRLIATSFSGKLKQLEAAGRALGGWYEADDPAYDLIMAFNAFPEVPLSLRFNDQDEDLPAQCTLLFKRSAETYLDLEGLTIVGTFLAGNLIQSIGRR